MITIPSEVKAALKSGSHLKNYRFKVKRKESVLDPINPIWTFNDQNRTYTVGGGITEGGFYYLYFSAEQPTVSVGGLIIMSGGYIGKFTVDHTYGTETLYRIRVIDSGATIDFSNSIVLPTFPEFQLTTSNLITYTDTYVDDFVIDNNTLIKESVKIDERMDSGDILKYGLAEGTSLEFQYFGHGNIRGRRLYAELEVDYGDPRQFDVVATFERDSGPYTIPEDNTYRVSITPNSDQSSYICQYTIYEASSGLYRYYRLDSDTLYRDHTLKTGDRVSPGTLVNLNHDQVSVSKSRANLKYTIPIGWFDVEQCPMQVSTGIYKALAYNRLRSEYLDTPVNNLVANLQSDTQTAGDITIQSIQSILLKDFRINEKVTGNVVATEINYPITDTTRVTFVLNGQSTTRYMWASSKTVVATADPTKRVKIDMNKYLGKYFNAMANIKSAIYSKVKNPDTVWENLKNSYYYQLWMSLHCVFGQHGTTPHASYMYEMPSTIQSQFTTVGLIDKVIYLSGVSDISFQLPYDVFGTSSNSSSSRQTTLWQTDETLDISDVVVEEIDTDDIETLTVNEAIIAKGQVTLRDIINANYELHCQYGYIDRVTNEFSGRELARAATEQVTIDSCSKLWTDSAGEQSFKNLIITYKGLDENDQEKDFEYITTVNENGTIDYIMDDNWLMRNKVWDIEEVAAYADQMVTKMTNNHWTPFEMWCVGLPYLETGDMLQITDNTGSFASYILQRQLKGVHNLQDTYINGTLDVF